MAIAGSLIKHDAHKPTDAMSRYHLEGTLDSLLNNGDDGIQKPIFHVTVMPCHDKKLEAEPGRHSTSSKKHLCRMLTS
jgi:hypothetical protein